MIRKIALGLSVLILLFVLYFVIAILPISTGYAAKNLCSCMFVAGYTQDFSEAHDLNFSLVGLSRNKVDLSNKTVSSSFFGLARRKAIFRNKLLGCTLTNGTEEFINATVDTNAYGATPEIGIVSDTVSTESVDSLNIIPPSLKAEIDSILAHEINHAGNATRALLVMKNGKIIGEQYADPFDSTSLFIAWSMTKSFTATLIGRLVQQGLIDINDPAPVHLWKNDPIRSQITWKHLLQMNSGLKWTEVYSWRSTATRMLYLENNVFDFAIQAKPAYPPGTFWEYSSGTTNILSGLIRQTLQDDQTYHRLPYDVFGKTIGMSSFIMETDPAGNFIGSSYSYATARDYAKFGQLYLQDGQWEGQQILPMGWSKFIAEVAEGSNGRYGAQFWLNADGHMPDVPKDAYFADGFMGQRIFIIPSESMVVVRLGADYNKQTDYNALMNAIFSVIK